MCFTPPKGIPAGPATTHASPSSPRWKRWAYGVVAFGLLAAVAPTVLVLIGTGVVVWSFVSLTGLSRSPLQYLRPHSVGRRRTAVLSLGAGLLLIVVGTPTPPPPESSEASGFSSASKSDAEAPTPSKPAPEATPSAPVLDLNKERPAYTSKGNFPPQSILPTKMDKYAIAEAERDAVLFMKLLDDAEELIQQKEWKLAYDTLLNLHFPLSDYLTMNPIPEPFIAIEIRRTALSNKISPAYDASETAALFREQAEVARQRMKGKRSKQDWREAKAAWSIQLTCLDIMETTPKKFHHMFPKNIAAERRALKKKVALANSNLADFGELQGHRWNRQKGNTYWQTP